MRRSIVLFTRDLRVRDQRALLAAVRESEEVVPAFVLDRALLARSCGQPNRLAFLLEALRDLDASLRTRGARLVVLEGEPVREAIALAAEWGAQAIYMSDDVTPYARRRARLLADACAKQRIALHLLPGVTVVAPGELTPTSGDHYRVFTPYWRAWSQRSAGTPLPAPRRIAVPRGLPRARIPALRALTAASPSPAIRRGGESEGRRQLDRWLRAGLQQYGDVHDDLAGARTSHLSAHLHFGCLSARTVLARIGAHTSATDFARQLCWRDFHHQVLAARGDLPHADYRPRRSRWREDAHAAATWRRARTGYPIVDAGMRQLEEEGFMHNRARLIVASFLTKTLCLDWRIGAAHFARLLTDADIACNVGNWQWVAGTGNDTRPNRVLNPLRQAVRFDPRGDYVRRFLPELASIPGGAVHRPWLLPASARRGLRYPAPIVDHESAVRTWRAERRGPD